MAVREKTQFIPNEIYFITITICNWEKVFVNDKYVQIVFKWFDYMKRECGNKVFAYCVMPNHIHAIIRVSDRSPILSRLIQNAKRIMGFQIIRLLKEDGNMLILEVFSENANLKKGAIYKVFEDRYDSLIIYTRKFLLEKLNYIHRNPCQIHWSLVEEPEDYMYSSAANYILGTGVYNVDLVEF